MVLRVTEPGHKPDILDANVYVLSIASKIPTS